MTSPVEALAALASLRSSKTPAKKRQRIILQLLDTLAYYYAGDLGCRASSMAAALRKAWDHGIEKVSHASASPRPTQGKGSKVEARSETQDGESRSRPKLAKAQP